MVTVSAVYGSDTLTSEEQKFTQAFETFRTQYGLQLPTLDESLVEGSRNWSVRMRQSGSFSHGAARENIYRGSESGIAAFRAWERSPKHRALLLSPSIEAFGVGNSGTFWTFRARSRTVERAEAVPQGSQTVVARPIIVRTEFERPAMQTVFQSSGQSAKLKLFEKLCQKWCKKLRCRR